MIDISAVFSNFGGTYPNITAQNATGAGATDGTEFIAALVDNWMWGWQQALFTQEAITPNGVTEGSAASQILDALNQLFPVGCVTEWNRSNDPATDGLRFLLLNGQGIVRANYPALDAAVYVGDANNAAVAAGGGAYYHADDAAGTTPNTTGVYLILPESRGYTTRGLDAAASVDPDGSSRYLGDNQLDAFQGHSLTINVSGSVQRTASFVSPGAGTGFNGLFNGLFDGSASAAGFISDGVNGTPRTDSETRMVNRSTRFAIRY